MDNYSLYTPLRNLARQYNLQASLEDLSFYFQMLEGEFPMEKVWDGTKVVPIKQVVHRWELAILSREIVLNASPTGKLRLRPWNGLMRLVNLLRRVDNDMVREDSTFESSYQSLSPTGQLQFPWQRRRDLKALMRYFKVFSASAVDDLLLQRTGVRAKDWLVVGFAAAGNLRNKAGMSSIQDYSPVGTNREATQAVFEKLSQPFDKLKLAIQEVSRYDETWMYTWNPLEGKPLVSLDPSQPHLLHCPVPPYVLRRVSQGLYYEISSAEGFNNPFGDSFQAYVGEVLTKTFASPQFTVYEEREYKVGRHRKDGVDWILTDDQANVFLECKAKRMTQPAKSAVDPKIIGQQVDFLVRAVVQLYKNIADALGGHTHWPRNERPIYPVVVTLEDWLLFGTAADLLIEGVIAKMEEANLDLTWLDSMPYTVASCAEFETVSQTIAEVGIHTFFDARRSREQQKWMLEMFAKDAFPEVYQRTYSRDLFREEWTRILPPEAIPFPVS